MKIKREEFQRSKEQHPLELFRQGIRSKQTLEKYERTLKWLLNHFLEDNRIKLDRTKLDQIFM